MLVLLLATSIENLWGNCSLEAIGLDAKDVEALVALGFCIFYKALIASLDGEGKGNRGE